ncbi:MAG: hypothetical protein A2W01_05115 [Candidatus Solincola sediminis]|uniref:NYN domain-containing protein n=1 Tax=Candidatus Solincola sediminis TaxID=1797199 RepID=A0A1F2WF76_9ACTN|nr:MAG: hypothetical protein A2Y75_09370 [Candidatus Solincola sediminis]OFW57798.1 MAG: hypothetical protein A2W01_05115 [Candidatus Solincola sediminis]
MKAVVVDGYNLVHSQPRLKAALREGHEQAREALIKELSPLASPGRYDLLMVVFDAAGSSQLEPAVENRLGIIVVYTRRGQSADAFIEAAVKHLVTEAEVEVSTSDRAVRDVCAGFGARPLDPSTLLELGEEASSDISREIQDMKKDNRSPLEDRVSKEVRHLLDEMRYH